MTSSRSGTSPSSPESLTRLSGRVVLAGVGCRGRGDDAFGPLLAERLAGCPNLCVLDCGDRLEDYTGEIARARPDIVLIADAAALGGWPGEVALIEADALPRGTETHRPSLRVAMEYLRMTTGATVLLLGVQPGVIADTEELSAAVAARLEQLAAALEQGAQQTEVRTDHEP